MFVAATGDVINFQKLISRFAAASTFASVSIQTFFSQFKSVFLLYSAMFFGSPRRNAVFVISISAFFTVVNIAILHSGVLIKIT